MGLTPKKTFFVRILFKMGFPGANPDKTGFFRGKYILLFCGVSYINPFVVIPHGNCRLYNTAGLSITITGIRYQEF